MSKKRRLAQRLATSLTMDQFAWTKKEAMYYMGVLMSVGAVIACGIFIVIKPLTRRFQEYKIMLWGGFFFMILGRVLYIPWGDEPPKIAEVLPANISENSPNYTEPVGCPPSQEWCYYTPAMTITQLLIGYFFTTVGYPVAVTLIQTIFSKVLGPRPQGTWMGWITGAGCLSRVLGPVFIGYIYTWYGTYWTFGITSVMIIAVTIWLFCMEKHIMNAVEDQTNYERIALEQNKHIEVPIDEEKEPLK